MTKRAWLVKWNAQCSNIKHDAYTNLIDKWGP